jgi:hypothetical protein
MAGERTWVTIKLAGLPAYEGGMTGLAIDLPDGVTVHDVCLGAEGASTPTSEKNSDAGARN